MRARLVFVLTCVVFLFSGTSARVFAQATAGDQTGVQPYQSYNGGSIDSVNLTSGTLNLNVPFLSYPQRGKLHFSFNLLYNNQWQHYAQYCSTKTYCYLEWGYNPDPGKLPLEISDAFVAPAQQLAIAGSDTAVVYNPNLISSKYTVYYGHWLLQMADGSEHPLGNEGTLTRTGSNPLYLEQASGPFETLDGTGWRVNATFTASYIKNYWGGTPTSIIGPDGVQYSTLNAFEEDPNGNMVTLNGGVFTDSVGRQIPSPPNPATAPNTDTSECPQPPQVELPVDHAVLWSVPGPAGGTTDYKFCYAKDAINIPAGPGSLQPVASSDMILQSIVLPNGQTWDFTYNDPGDGSTYNGSPINYGTLTQVKLPSGGTISYTYTMGSGFNVDCQNSGRWVATRTVDANDGSGPHQWTYAYSPSSDSTTVTDPLGNYTVHTFVSYGACSPYETNTQYYQSGGSLLKTVTTIYNTPGSDDNWPTNVVPVQVTTSWPNGKISSVTKSYDAGFSYTGYMGAPGTGIYGKVVSQSDYDYGGGGIGPLLKTTNTNYLALSNSTYLTNNLLDAVSSQQVLNGNGIQQAYTSYGYDESGLNPSGISIQHDPSPSDGSARGNQTSIHRWLSGSAISTPNCQVSVSNGYLVSYATYNDTGTLYQSTDSCGQHASDPAHTTTYGYSADYAGAYPTTVTNPLNQTTQHTYDFNTGLLLSTTDPNSQTTTYTYDSMWRLASVSYPDGGLTTITRQESVFPFSATLTKKINSQQTYSTTNVFDGLGRLTQNQISDPQGTIYTDTTYDADGRVSGVSNPYRTKADPTYGVTAKQYDALNRPVLVTKPDGNTIQTAYCGPSTLVTDETGRWRRSTVDGLGRMIEVDEPNSSTATVNSSGCPGTGEPIWTTTYNYDALGDLTSIIQGGSHNRMFTYDSLKQLTSALNPETGAQPVTYVYDADGNVISKTDARGITSTYSYDQLNRIYEETYSDGTPTVTYGYDGVAGLSGCQPSVSGNDSIGHRTSMCDAAGTESWAYNIIANQGLQTTQQRTTNGVPKTTVMQDDLDGNLVALTYPSGRTITYTYDSADRPSEAQDITNGINFVAGTCANGVNSDGVCYGPQGALTSISLGESGSFAGTTVAESYNDRLEPSEIMASSSAGTAMDLTYNFIDSAGHNNGDVIGIADDKDTSRSQTFTYDQVNRIVTAETSSTTGPNCWGETYGYDQWANLTTIGAVSAYSGCTQENLSALANASNQLMASGFTYDTAGNMLSDGANSYTWNAEGEISSAAATDYTYDGDGNRLVKSSGKIYWYGGSSEVLAESGLSGTISDEYIYFGGRRVAHVVGGSAAYYYIQDFLGSSRVIINSQGSVCYDADFYPYGGERVVSDMCSSNYLFEGKERDPETGNDNFGARYYSSRLGRWLSADWSAIPEPVPYANLTNPQTLNLYAMVSDNPETFADLDGHHPPPAETGGTTPSPENKCLSSTLSSCDKTPPAQKHRFWWKVAHALGIVQTPEEQHREAEFYRHIIPGMGGMSDQEVLHIVHTVMAMMAPGEGVFGEASETAEGLGDAAANANKLNHIFGNAAHNLDSLVSEFGSQEAAYNALQKATQEAVRQRGLTGVFETSVRVGNQTVTVRGAVVDGVAKIGTAFQ